MSHTLEILMYQTGQIFLIPMLVAIALLFLYSFYALGAFGVQGWQRRSGTLSFDKTQGYPLVAWAREHMAAYKVPRIVEFADALPKSGSGKVMWRLLQEQEAAGR